MIGDLWRRDAVFICTDLCLDIKYDRGLTISTQGTILLDVKICRL